MSKESVSKTRWDEYLEELYDWVNEKYKLLEAGEIDLNEYNDHLEYYNTEKQRINNIVTLSLDKTEEERKSSQLSQEAFEEFFGVKVDDDLSEPADAIAQPTVQPKRTPIGANNQKATSFAVKKPAEKELWEYVEKTPADVGFETKEQDVDQTIQANILLIGDSAVGRTSLRRSWMGKHFIESHLTTIGASIEKKSLVIDGIKYNITLTDLGGQDFYSGLRKNFYRNIDGAIIVFDLTRKETFRRIEFWVREFFRESKKLVPFLLVGNKAESKNRVIQKKEAQVVAEKYSKQTVPKFQVRYRETSAKSGSKVNEVFEIICKEIKSFKLQSNRGQ
ncbi:MAG: Rab family GTPase [Candidatus Kariarchaeaceae archaeon]|jgi:small GTP-binding protein